MRHLTPVPAIVQQRDQQLVALEEQITQADSDGIFARWLSGREMLRDRVGKQLPAGRLDELARKLGRSRQELGYRMQFADTYKTEDEVSNAIGNFGSWYEITQNLPSRSRGGSSRRPDPVVTPGLPLRVAYADPPYPGQAERHYGDQPSYGGEVDHGELLERLRGYDGWCLHTSSVALPDLLSLCPPDIRVMAWVKPFAAFKANIPVAYAWEPVLVKSCRKPLVRKREVVVDGKPRVEVMRDWIDEPITMQKGLAGAKPARVCWWLFDVLGMNPGDTLDDLYPGTGAVTDAWKTWCEQVEVVA